MTFSGKSGGASLMTQTPTPYDGLFKHLITSPQTAAAFFKERLPRDLAALFLLRSGKNDVKTDI